MHFSGEVEEREEQLNKQKVVAWVGIDWADEGHEVWEYTVQTDSATCYAIKHSAESLQEWVNQLRIRHGGKPVAVVLEQARGGLIYALMNTGFMEIYQ